LQRTAPPGRPPDRPVARRAIRPSSPEPASRGARRRVWTPGRGD